MYSVSSESYARRQSTPPSYAAATATSRRSDVDRSDVIFRLEDELGKDDADDEFDNSSFAAASRPAPHHHHKNGNNVNSSSRQEFLRSYTFSRKQPVHEKVKSGLLRMRAAAWTVVACNFRLSPRARRIRDKLAFRPSRLVCCGAHRQRRSSIRPPVPLSYVSAYWNFWWSWGHCDL